MTSLLVGDPHGRISNVKDFERFLTQLIAVVGKGKYDQVVILGDLFDSFAVIRSEIMALWTQFMIAAGTTYDTKLILLVGNHDMAGETGGSHSLEPFRYFKNVNVVDKPMTIGGIHCAPFMRDNSQFEQYTRSLDAGAVLFCHQSFNGAKFENGFYDPHGADPSSVAHLAAVISGHIHQEQTIQNIWYPGTPYQLTFSDAGSSKGVWEVNLTPKGYNNPKKITLDMPVFTVIQGSFQDLKDWAGLAVSQVDDADLAKTSVKFISTGSPQEIAEFWKDENVRTLRSKARRVVDALTTVRAEKALPGMKAKTQREKLHEFINSRQWRTKSDDLARAAEECLSQ